MKIIYTTLFLMLISFGVYPQSVEQQINNAIERYENEIDKIYHSKTINLLFNKHLGNYVTSVEVPSVKTLSAVLDNDENSLSFGYSFDWRSGDQTSYLSWLPYIGLKIKGKREEGFYTIFESDKAKNNIGAEAKITFFVPGSIWTGENDVIRKDIKENRKKEIRKKALQAFEDKTNLTSGQMDNFIAKEEADYIMRNEKYNSFSKIWFTFRGYYPITDNEYALVDNAADFNKSTSTFKHWDTSLSFNFFRYFQSGRSVSFSVIPRVYNNNNILTEALESETFTTFETITTSQPVITDSEDLYVGDFDEFITSQIKAELTSFLFFKGTMGLSAAIERNYGSQYDPTNWKLGVPVSLKNSKGESEINFEIQWREIHKNHYIGISVGKAFGKFVD